VIEQRFPLYDAPVVAHVVRSGFVESVHHGSVVALDANGSTLLAVGDLTGPIFPRSSSKPIQALAMLRAGLDLDGELLIEGQDLRSGPFGATEYEYAVTVPTAQLPKLVAALGLETDDEVIAYLLANGESIVKQGERTWVEGLGITPGFWSRIEFDD